MTPMANQLPRFEAGGGEAIAPRFFSVVIFDRINPFRGILRRKVTHRGYYTVHLNLKRKITPFYFTDRPKCRYSIITVYKVLTKLKNIHRIDSFFVKEGLFAIRFEKNWEEKYKVTKVACTQKRGGGGTTRSPDFKT